MAKKTKGTRHPRTIGKPLTREYLRGVRDTLRAMFENGAADTWQREDTRSAAESLGVPFLYMALLEDEAMQPPPLTAADLTEFETWLTVNEIDRDFALGEEA